MSKATQTILGSLYTDELKKRAVWEKGHVAGFLSDGNVIHYSAYGNALSPYGWEFDHYPTPKSQRGSDEIWNLRPLHCSTNRSLGGLLDRYTRS